MNKAFGISFAFHSLMALFPLLLLTSIHPPLQPFVLPIKHITLLAPTASTVTPTAQPKIPVPVKSLEPILATPIQPLPNPITPLQKTVSTPTPQASPSQIAPPIVSNTPPIIAAKPVTTPIAPPVQVPTKPVQKVDLTNEMQSFKASLRTKIKQLLQYPPSARRRGMEGEVNVHFVLDNTGAIHDITINQGESIFHDAAKLAVASASGIKIPDKLSESFPKEMQLTLEFKLD